MKSLLSMHFPPKHKSTPAKVSCQKHKLLKEAVPWQASEGLLPVPAHPAGCNPCLCFQFLQLCMLAAPLHGCHHSLWSSVMRPSARNALQEVLQWLPVSLWRLQARKELFQHQVRRGHLEVSQKQHSFSLPVFSNLHQLVKGCSAGSSVEDLLCYRSLCFAGCPGVGWARAACHLPHRGMPGAA